MIYYKAQIYGIFVITVLFLMCWFGIKQREKTDKIFNVVLIAGFVNLCFDILSNYTVNHLETVPPLVNRVIHIGFFISLSTMFVLVYKYLGAIIERELGRPLKGKYLSMVPYYIVTLGNIFLPLYYVETENGNYSYGLAPMLLYVGVGTYMVMIIILTIMHRKSISAKNMVAIILALVSVLSTSIFQVLIPVALTSSLGVIMFCLCMYMTVANPDAVLVALLQEETARADAANRAKSDFLAKMSHEIRTPINAVLGMNEMILRESKEPEIKQYAYDIKSSASALLSIINEILDSSKIESGKMELMPDNYEISSLFNDLYNMIGVRAKDKELALVFDIDPDIPTEYYGDDIRIRQVLVNLLTNAVKYTTEGTITLKVTGKVEGEDAVLHFSVKDTGIGIKEEDLEKLFARFERIEEARNRNVEGTGLGMYIAMQLLRMMGSELQVKSVYGEGSEFSFAVVQKVTNFEPLGDFHQRILDATKEYTYETSYIAPKAKILVVDDNEMNRKVFKNLLKQTKITIYEAGSGEECITILEQQEFDMIFLDYMMPNMDGVETLHRLQNRNLCKSTPVIMLTANAVVGARENYLKEGFDDYLSKPIMPDKLDKMILGYLPETLIEKGDYVRETAGGNEEVSLPALDEFDFDYALSLLKSEELVQKTLEDFYRMLGKLPEELSELYGSIAEAEARNLYRIQVHALKSSAATVGAMLLSKLARMVEVAAIEENTEKIGLLHPLLMEEMEKHRERIAAILPKEEDEKVPAETSFVLPYFEMLKAGLENDDYNTADFVSAELQKYSYEPDVQSLMEELVSQVMNLEAEDAIMTIDRIQGIMEGKV